jgi:hypothetical protein
MATQEEAIFCKIAVKNKLLTPEQCQECEQVRKQSGGEKGLIDVIIEKGYLSPKVVLAIFKAQAEVSADQTKRPVKEARVGDSSLTLLEPGQVPETQPTIQGEIVSEDAPTPVLPAAPRPGDESYERLRREVSQMPFATDSVKGAENVVYNINIRNVQSTDGDKAGGAEPPKPGDGALVPYAGGLTLRRDDLSEAQLLALLKGYSVNLPAKMDMAAAQMQAAQAMAPVAIQHNILTAVRQNLLVTLLGLGIIAAMVVVGVIFLRGRETVVLQPPAQSQPQAPQQPTVGVTKDTSMTELMARLEAGTSSIMKVDAAKEIGRRAGTGEDTTGIKGLVKALRDTDPDVVREIKFQLLQFKSASDPARAEQLRNDTYTNMSVLFGEYDANFKNNCVTILKGMGISEKDMLELLQRGLKDADPRARANSLDSVAEYAPQSTIPLVAPLALDGDPSVRLKAREFLWAKGGEVKDQSALMTALNNPAISVEVLNELIDFLWPRKDAAFNARIVLFISHPDGNIKAKILTLLQQAGPEADQYFNDPAFVQAFTQLRDATVAAQPPNVALRTTMVNVLGAIHGQKSGDLLMWHVRDDPDPNIKTLARGFIASCPDPVKNALAGYDQVVVRAQIDAQKARIAAAVALLAKGDLEGFYPQAEAIIADTNPILDTAFSEIPDLKDRATFNAKYLDARKSGGYVYITDPKSLLPQPPPNPQNPTPPPPPKMWVKVAEAFDIIAKGAEALAGDPNYKFAEALKLLREMPSEVLAMEGMQQRLQVAVANLQALGEGYAKSSVDLVNNLMLKDNFPDADTKIKDLEGKFTKEDFAEAYRRTVEERKKYADAFREWRSKIMVLAGNEKPEDILQKYGIPLGKPQNFPMPCVVKLALRTLEFNLDPDGKHNIVNVNFAWTLAVNPPRDSSDFQALALTIQAPGNSTVTVEVKCGAVITYKRVFNVQGDLLMNLDDSTQSGGYGQKRQNIDSVTIRVNITGDPHAPTSPRIYIGGVRLTGKP